jgi:excisionase family DNA binding protein
MSRTSDRGAVPTPRRSLERLLSADEVAEFLGIPVSTLYQWRHRGCGPDAYRIGRHLRYEVSAVRSWLDEQRATRRGVG